MILAAIKIDRIGGSLRLVAFASLAACAGCDSSTFTDGFEDAETGFQEWKLDMDPSCTFETTSAEIREGSLAFRIEAPEGARCEIVPGIYAGFIAKFVREPYDEERWYRFSVFVEENGAGGYPEDMGDNTIVAQWHSSPDFLPKKEAGRGPPLALRMIGGRWGITYGWDPDLRSDQRYLANKWHWVGPVERGRWIDWSFRVVWSYDGGGITEVRKDGELVMQRAGPNVYNDFRGVYMKLGLYHPTADKTVLLDRVSIGPK